MSSACSLLRFGHVLGPIHMTGQSAHLSTLERTLVEEIQGSTTIAVCLVLNFARVHADAVICANMLMGCLSAGYTLLSIVPACARMVQAVLDESAFLPILRRSLGPCMSLLDLQSHLLGQLLLQLV